MTKTRERVIDTMSGSDALLWTMGRDPILRPTIVAVMALDRAPRWADVRGRIAKLTDLVPRLRSRVIARPVGRGRPQFVADRSFDLDLHLRRMELPVGGTFRDVLDIAEVMATTGFDPELPLWESVVVEGVDGARAAFLIKMHHALVDGVGGIAVLLHLLDTVRRPSRKPVAPYHATPAPPPLSLLKRLPDPRHVIDMAVRTATHPVDEMEHVVATAESVARLLAPAGAPLSPLMTGRSFRRAIEVVDLPPGALRQVATATSGTLNDVFVAAIMGGLRRYHELPRRRHRLAPGADAGEREGARPG